MKNTLITRGCPISKYRYFAMEYIFYKVYELITYYENHKKFFHVQMIENLISDNYFHFPLKTGKMNNSPIENIYL